MDEQNFSERLKNCGRNDPCPCGSGRKYKKCHLAADEQLRHEATLRAAEEAAAAETEETESDDNPKDAAAPKRKHRESGHMHKVSQNRNQANIPRRGAI